MNKKRKYISNNRLAAIMKLMGWVFLLLLPLAGNASDVEVIKTIQKAYSLEGDELIRLSNKYGKIHINTWDKNQVTIEVTISAYGPNESIAQQRLNEASVEFDRSSDEITMATKHSSDLDVKTSKKGVKVAYRLNLPASNPVEIYSKFCDVYLGNRKGSLILKHANGKVVLGKLKGNKNYLQLAFAQTDLAYFGGGKIALSYGKMTLNSAKDIYLSADGAHVRIGEVDEIYLKTNLSNLEINQAREVKGIFASADFRLAKLNSLLDMEVKYAKSFEITEVSENFKGVRLRSLYSPINLKFAHKVNFRLQAKVKFGELSYDSENVSMTIFEDETNKLTQYIGRFGSDQGPKGLVEIESQYGHIRIE